MTIVNRRNAIVGWITLKALKVVAREEARKLGRKARFAPRRRVGR
jgi:hypothetical protein